MLFSHLKLHSVFFTNTKPYYTLRHFYTNTLVHEIDSKFGIYENSSRIIWHITFCCVNVQNMNQLNGSLPSNPIRPFTPKHLILNITKLLWASNCPHCSNYLNNVHPEIQIMRLWQLRCIIKQQQKRRKTPFCYLAILIASHYLCRKSIEFYWSVHWMVQVGN